MYGPVPVRLMFVKSHCYSRMTTYFVQQHCVVATCVCVCICTYMCVCIKIVSLGNLLCSVSETQPTVCVES